MSKLAKLVERILQVVTIISGIWAIVEMIKANLYKKKLKAKADEYIEEEMAFEGDIRGSVAVYSPTIKENEKKVASLLAITGISCLGMIILSLINRNEY